MQYLIYQGGLWEQSGNGDGWASLTATRPIANGQTETITIDLGDNDLIVDPTDQQLADLSTAELARFGLTRANLTGNPPGRRSDLSTVDRTYDAAQNAVAIALAVDRAKASGWQEANSGSTSGYGLLVEIITTAAIALTDLSLTDSEFWQVNDWYLTTDAIAVAVLIDDVTPKNIAALLVKL